MYKFAFDRLDYMRDNPYPNLWDNNVIAHYHNNSNLYNFDTNTQEFVLHTCHSELYGNMIKNKNNHTIIREEYEHMQFYLYPIELFGDHRNLIKEERESKTGIKYNTAFIKNVSRQAVQMAKWEKLKFVVNYSHEPFSDIEFLNIFSEQIQSIGLREDHFIFFVGTSNLLELYPELEHRGFVFLFEDSIITSTARKIKDLKSNPNYTLGYETKWIDETEIGVKRNKHFVCLNRSSNKPHRYTLGCFFENKNMWDKVYASFLRPNENKHWMYETGDVDFDYEMAEASDEFAKKIPIEIDTQNSQDKESFEVAKAFKKEIYLDSYIYIVTETNFERDIFLTEKICNPIAVLQPFILFGACGYLKYLRSLGFKTFDGFIDESYDSIEDNKQRYLALCKEIERISNLPLEEIHSWYLSIKDILIHNRNHLLSFADKVMFKDNLDKLTKKWIEFQMQFEK